MNAGRAVGAAAIATATMTALLLVEPSVGLPMIAVGETLSTSLAFASAYLPVGPAMGWLIHLLVGILLGLVYAWFFVQHLPGSPVARGILYGVLIFFVAQMVFMPFIGSGVFSRGDPALLAGSLLGHAVYGAVLGWIYGETPPALTVAPTAKAA